MRRRSQTGIRAGAGGQGTDAGSCVAEVMGTELFTLTPDTVVASALRLAASKRIHHFLVVEDGNLTGIVCQQDLESARRSMLVGQCMSSPVLCIGPETTLKEAAGIMEQNEVGCLPIVTGAFLVGVITRDKLKGMGVTWMEPDEGDDDDLEEIEAEAAEVAALACVSCGSEIGVRREVRAGMTTLCGDCAAVIPAAEPIRGN